MRRNREKQNINFKLRRNREKQNINFKLRRNREKQNINYKLRRNREKQNINFKLRRNREKQNINFKLRRNEAKYKLQAEKEQREAEYKLEAEKEQREAEYKLQAEKEQRQAEYKLEAEKEQREAEYKLQAEKEQREAEYKLQAEKEQREAEYKLEAEKPKQWHRYINALLLAYREVPQDSTYFAPLELMYSRTVKGPIHILRELRAQKIDEHEVKSSYQYVLDLRERLNNTVKLAKEQLESSQARLKKYFHKQTKARRFGPGNKVLVLLPTDTNKLLVQWKGPYMGSNDYKVEINGKKKTMHANLLKKYLSRDEETSSRTRDDLNVPPLYGRG
ncbi:hypothetical protein RRG08_005373 [Elysia crispata]|uniref:Uncharacterized protein n=1 Tax=Elysia crispata TaxID=231223 RepID=A0AAE1B379_9GAST|nr:hypothetical protein RRG08_005373 [Elysia crispata]